MGSWTVVRDGSSGRPSSFPSLKAGVLCLNPINLKLVCPSASLGFGSETNWSAGWKRLAWEERQTLRLGQEAVLGHHATGSSVCGGQSRAGGNQHGSHLVLTSPGPAGPRQGAEQQPEAAWSWPSRAAWHGLFRQHRQVPPQVLANFLASSMVTLGEILVSPSLPCLTFLQVKADLSCSCVAFRIHSDVQECADEESALW